MMTWRSDQQPPPILIATLGVPGADQNFLFGYRHDISDALVGGKSFGIGHFIEYAVAQKALGCLWTVHRLVQQHSVTFTATMEAGDRVAASEVEDVDSHCLGELPRWRWSEANWPIHHNRPMTFVAQFDLPDSQVTRTLLAANVRVFLFTAPENGQPIFKIVEEDMKTQSAGEHYALEDSIDRLAGARKRRSRPKASE